MLIEPLLFLIGLISLIISFVSDLKTTEIPDYTNYFLIFSALSLRALYSFISKDWSFILTALKLFPLIFALALFMYYSKQWGGGDAKLIMGLSLAFATYPSFLTSFFSPDLSLPFPIILFINILLAGLVYSIFYSIYLSFKHSKTFFPNFKAALKKTKKTQFNFFILFLLLILTSFFIKNKMIKILLPVLAFLALFLIYFYFYIKILEKTCLIKTIPISQLREGDYITQNIFYKDKLIHKRAQELTQKQIELIKKTSLKKIEIKEGIIFTPAFLIGFLISLIFGNLLIYFF